MEQIIFKPSLYKYGTCREFAEGFQLKETDLILTNEYIYQPYFGAMHRILGSWTCRAMWCIRRSTAWASPATLWRRPS